MRIGISVSSSYPNTDPRQAAAYMVARARAAAQAGLASLFVGDHHVTPTPYYQNGPMLGRMLAEWGAQPAGALYLLPLWHPVLVAEQTATLASIAQGPFIMQCGLGGDVRQSAGMGVNIKFRPSMFEQSLAIIRRLWAGETLDAEGYWQLKGARIAPLPPESISVWIGASADPAIARAARLGDVWLAEPGITPAQAGARMAVYQAACAEQGRTPKQIAIRRDIYIGPSSQAAQASMAPYLARGYRGFAPEALVIGDVAAAVDAFGALADLGFTDVLVRNITSKQDEALACIERLAQVQAQLANS